MLTPRLHLGLLPAQIRTSIPRFCVFKSCSSHAFVSSSRVLPGRVRVTHGSVTMCVCVCVRALEHDSSGCVCVCVCMCMYTGPSGRTL